MWEEKREGGRERGDRVEKKRTSIGGSSRRARREQRAERREWRAARRGSRASPAKVKAGVSPPLPPGSQPGAGSGRGRSGTHHHQAVTVAGKHIPGPATQRTTRRQRRAVAAEQRRPAERRPNFHPDLPGRPVLLTLNRDQNIEPDGRPTSRAPRRHGCRPGPTAWPPSHLTSSALTAAHRDSSHSSPPHSPAPSTVRRSRLP